ncbi:MAG: TIGR03016 family PEP-CTERM system-associated outer membrane protein [Betaproteobacteria bacterium]|nr:TIGR03016 family PEP-CTERM system-associated outer membrane protein [Betaproteobacteria bacterium]
MAAAVVLVWPASAASQVQSQEAARQGTTLSPALAVAERYSSNAFPEEADPRRTAWITDLSGRLVLVHRSASAEVSADMRWQRLFYSSLSTRNSTRRSLNASARMELLDDLLDVRARGAVTQQGRSAFSASLPDASQATNDGDRVQSRTWTVRPDFHSRLGSQVVTRAWIDAIDSRTEEANARVQRSITSVASLGSDQSSGNPIGWSISGQQQRFDADDSDREIRRAQATVQWNPGGAFGGSLFAGRETSDLRNGQSNSTSIVGGGVRWIPSERVALAATAGKRFFGTEYAAALAYRRALTALRLTAARDVAYLESRSETGAASPFLSMLADLLRASIPDQGPRQDAAQRRLQDAGIPVALGAPVDALNARPFLNQRLDLSFLYTSPRDNLTLSAGYRKQTELEANPSALPSPFDPIRQQSAGLAWSHRLDRSMTLNYSFSYLQTEGIRDGNRETTQRQHSLSTSKRLGPRLTLSFLARHLDIKSSVIRTYVENSVGCNLDVRF